MADDGEGKRNERLNEDSLLGYVARNGMPNLLNKNPIPHPPVERSFLLPPVLSVPTLNLDNVSSRWSRTTTTTTTTTTNNNNNNSDY